HSHGVNHISRVLRPPAAHQPAAMVERPALLDGVIVNLMESETISRIAKKQIPRTYQAVNEPPWVRRLLIGIALVFLAVFLVVPLLAVFFYALEKGVSAYLQAFGHAETLSAIRLTLLTAGIDVA